MALAPAKICVKLNCFCVASNNGVRDSASKHVIEFRVHKDCSTGVIQCILSWQITVFAVISAPALISAPPHISQLIELLFLNMPVFKSSFYHVWLLRYWHFKYCNCENPIKTSHKYISATKNDRNMIWKLASSANCEESEFNQSEKFCKRPGRYYDEYGMQFGISQYGQGTVYDHRKPISDIFIEWPGTDLKTEMILAYITLAFYFKLTLCCSIIILVPLYRISATLGIILVHILMRDNS